jgi:hypothetical protein
MTADRSIDREITSVLGGMPPSAGSEEVRLRPIFNEETVFRQQAAKLQNDLRADQAVIAQQRDQLEIERK